MILSQGEVANNHGPGIASTAADVINDAEEDDYADMPPLVDLDSDDEDDEKNLLFASSSDIVPPALMEDSDDEDDDLVANSADNIAPASEDNAKIDQLGAEPLVMDPSGKCFGPCGGKTCKERDQWRFCRNNSNDFVKCTNIVGEQCQISHDGYCRICIIAGSTASKRYSSINYIMAF